MVIQKVRPLTSPPSLTMTTTVALANDDGVKPSHPSWLEPIKVPVLRVRRNMHGGTLRAAPCHSAPAPYSSGQSPVHLDRVTMLQGSAVPFRTKGQHLSGGEGHQQCPGSLWQAIPLRRPLGQGRGSTYWQPLTGGQERQATVAMPSRGSRGQVGCCASRHSWLSPQ